MTKNQEIVVHPRWINRSENLGIGCNVYKNIDTGESWKEYDLGAIVRAEKEIQKQLDKDPTIQFYRGLLTLCAYYVVAKKKIKEYFKK